MFCSAVIKRDGLKSHQHYNNYNGEASPTFGHANFLCLWTAYKESISKEMNNDNDLNLHSMPKLPGWLCY